MPARSSSRTEEWPNPHDLHRRGLPTVIFESSGFGGADSSGRAREEVKSAKVCSYDRMGMCWSSPGPSTITAGTLLKILSSSSRKPGSNLLSFWFFLARRHYCRVLRPPASRPSPRLVFVDAGNSIIVKAFKIARFGSRHSRSASSRNGESRNSRRRESARN